MLKTKIVCTIGPATNSQKMIEKMHCPTEQKLELVDAVVNGIKAEKKAAKV